MKLVRIPISQYSNSCRKENTYDLIRIGLDLSIKKTNLGLNFFYCLGTK